MMRGPRCAKSGANSRSSSKINILLRPLRCASRSYFKVARKTAPRADAVEATGLLRTNGREQADARVREAQTDSRQLLFHFPLAIGAGRQIDDVNPVKVIQQPRTWLPPCSFR